MKTLLIATAAASALAMVAPHAQAQSGSSLLSSRLSAPNYGSGTAAGAMSNSDFNTPESDGRPGVKAYAEGMEAYSHGDYTHAIHMLKVAASWAYKPAEYNLGAMYFDGQGVPADRPMGAAWLVLAAERGDPHYVAARDWAITLLSESEFARTDALWAQLKQTYGDGVALRRAKAQWAYVRTHETGTRVGGTVGELHVGIPAAQGTWVTATTSDHGTVPIIRSSWMSVLTGPSTDGSLAYQQFGQSDNPYDRIFINNPAGTATVGPLSPIKATDRQSRKPPDNDHNF